MEDFNKNFFNIENKDNFIGVLTKTYIGLKVRLIFDPPTSGSVMQAYKELISEYEWRLNVTVDPSEVD